MKTLSIDIETYSDEPLQKTGVYRYVESPNFEILLFARDFAFKKKDTSFTSSLCGKPERTLRNKKCVLEPLLFRG